MPLHKFTVVHQVYHQVPGQKPLKHDVRSERNLDSEETEAFTTGRGRAKPVWSPLDLSWVKTPVCILITNNARHTGNRIAYPAELAVVASQVLLLTYLPLCDTELGFMIQPGEDIRISPTSWEDLRIRSLSKLEVPYTLLAIPG